MQQQNTKIKQKVKINTNNEQSINDLSQCQSPDVYIIKYERRKNKKYVK